MVWFFEEDIVFQHSPFLFLDSLDAVERIEEAIEGGENIAVYGDRDCDGITSTAILVKELKRMGAGNLTYRLPLGDEPYGLTDELVDEFIKNGITLLITVDNGISALNQIRALRNNGIDTIVLDHHLPGDEFPPAYAILDPKVEGSGYPFSDPAACASARPLYHGGAVHCAGISPAFPQKGGAAGFLPPRQKWRQFPRKPAQRRHPNFR